jgi:hypothetical protein
LAKKPPQLPLRSPLPDAVIETARYVGSKEHKVERWWGGLPGAYKNEDGKATRPSKQDTTICPLVTATDRDNATGWVRAALRNGQVKYVEGDKDFPKKIWYQEGPTGPIWSGLCVNSVAGEYKGWPISEDERREIFGQLP